MAITRKKIVDAIFILAERFSRTDESRIDEDYLSYLVDQVRVSEILKEYNVTHVIDQNWLVDFGIYDLTRVSFADDPLVDFCECDISKAEIPEIISLTTLGDGNLDLGLKVISACGKTSYTRESIEIWKMIPKEHVRSKFSYYQRFGNIIYVNKVEPKLRFIGIPASIDGLMIKKTLPIISGSVQSGYSYTVKGSTGSLIYNGTTYLPNDTFTGVLGVTTFTASGTSQLFYTNYQVPMTQNDPYPVSSHMARQIVVSILTTELKLEQQQVVDVVNDSVDDVLKGQ
jgi:hypothetical protein